MKNIAITILLFNSIQLFSQTEKMNFQIGVGLSNYDLFTQMTSLEFELNYKINNYFSSSVFFDFGNGGNKFLGYSKESFFQENINIFLSPFKNNKKNNFKLGTGLMLIQPNPKLCQKSNLLGMNIIIENNYLIKEKLIIGLKLYEQLGFNCDILNIGLMVKLGLLI